LEKGEGRREKGDAVAEIEIGCNLGGDNFPNLAESREYFSRNGSDYSREEVDAAWHTYTAGKVNGKWMIGTGRGQRPVGDWRSALEARMADVRRWAMEKNCRTATATSGGRTPAQARYEVCKELEAVRARLAEASELTIPPAPEDEAREKELEKELRGMDATDKP
jgi:hypothetical protein